MRNPGQWLAGVHSIDFNFILVAVYNYDHCP